MTPGELLRDLIWPADREAPPAPGLPADQSERALDLVWLAMLAGVATIALLALGQPGVAAAARTFTTAVLAAIVAAGGGALIGLLFGMPASAGSTIVATPPPAATGGTEDAPAPATSGDWYRDNTALERLSDWLTTAIVALTIANFRDLMDIAGDVSAAVGAAMALSPPPSAASRGVAGGLVLGAYFVLGFLGGYLWSRRYLRTILSTGRKEALDIERRADAAKFAAAQDANGVQAAPRTDEAATQASAAVEEVSNTATESARAGGPSFPPPVAPGGVPDDPWKGQFGGQSRRGSFTLEALVAPLSTSPGQFSIELRIGSYDPRTMQTQRHAPLRLYLHPSFPDPIRMLELGDRGVLYVPLVAYGAFTVGVQFEDDTRLELDLARLPTAPADFRLN